MVDQSQFQLKAKQIRARVPAILSQWGLSPKFNRWRLTQDPDSGMVVLFAVLNTRYIATHTATPFSNYFDPRLLHDLTNNLHTQVVTCNSGELRYAFILDRGQIDILPTHIDIPFLDGDRLLVRVVYDDKPLTELVEAKITPAPQIPAGIVLDQTRVHQGIGALLKVLDENRLKEDAASKLAHQDPPEVVVIATEEFNKRVAEHEADRRRSKHLKKLFDETGG